MAKSSANRSTSARPNRGSRRRSSSSPDTATTTNYHDANGEEFLAAGALVPNLPWVVIVEQPTSEAMALACRLQTQLFIAIGLALLGTVILGWLWGRSFITRIFALKRATQAIAEGRMNERVAVSGRDEIRQLGDAFNSMADRLVQLQEDVRRQERQAMFGKIAAGLVHDLSHPIQTIVTNSKLIVRMFDDVEYRDTFKRMIERESLVIKRVLEDLRNIAQPIPLEHFPVDIDRSVADVVESLQQPAETAGVTLRAELGSDGALVQGDVFALGRVYRNLLINAIQATAPGGLVAIATEATADRVQIRVYDTGCGIAPDRIGAIFDDFVTTKRRGLGLGLAISKKIVEQLGGQISVASEVGKGTTFVLDFPRTKARGLATRRRLTPGHRTKHAARWRAPATGGARGRLPERQQRRLLTGQDCVLQLLGDPRFHDGLGGNLDRLAGGRVAAHPRLPLLDDQLDHAWQHELASTLELLFGERRQFVEELSRLRPLHLEAIREVREQFGLAHPAGLCHRLFPLLGRAL